MQISTLVDSIFLSVYGGNPSDDVALARPQVQFWLQTNRDMLVKAYLDKQIQEGRALDTLYTERETSLATDAEDISGVDETEERIFFTLQKTPLTLVRDSGIVRIITSDGVAVLKTSLERVEVIKDLKYAKPSPTNLVFYRTGRDINVLGLNTKNLTTTTFIVYYIPSLGDQTLTEEDDIVLQDDLIPSLLDMVEQVARRELFGMPDDNNDGVQENTQRQSTDWRLLQPQQ